MTTVTAPPTIKLTNFINGQWTDSRAVRPRTNGAT